MVLERESRRGGDGDREGLGGRYWSGAYYGGSMRGEYGRAANVSWRTTQRAPVVREA